jgi:TPR repeat protein
MQSARRLYYKVVLTLTVVGFPIALMIVAFSSCDIRKRSEKHACKAGDVEQCLAVGTYYDDKRGGIVAFLASYSNVATVYYFEACKHASPTGCARMLDVYEHGESARNPTVDATEVADALIEACAASLADGCKQLESFMAEGVWVENRSAQAFARQCTAGRGRACWVLAGMHIKGLAGLRDTVGDVLPLLERACASKIEHSCEAAQTYRDRKAAPAEAGP